VALPDDLAASLAEFTIDSIEVPPGAKAVLSVQPGAMVYLYVSDADAVRAEWASCGVEGRLGEIRNTDYGMREFGFVDSDGTLHRVGSKLPW
jgi:hypothetical protein